MNNAENNRHLSTLFTSSLVGLVYLGLVFGKTFLAIQSEVAIERVGVVIPLTACLIFLAFNKALKTLVFGALLVIPYAILLLIGLANGNVTPYGVEKLDAAILNSAVFGSLLGYIIYRRTQLIAIKSFLLFSLLILLLTLSYKLHYGLFDRSVRFFLNGPIVYGWIMGACAILSFLQWTKSTRLLWILATVIFFLALMWTASKGPILVTLITLVTLTLITFGRKAVFPLITITLIFYFIITLLAQQPGFERLSAIQRLTQSDVTEADYGSIQVRQEMYGASTEIIADHPLIGVGLGNWGAYLETEFSYPHNVPLELMAELGIPLSIGFAIVYVAYAFLGGQISLILSLYFAGCMLFSGDIQYLRFPIAFQIAFLMNNIMFKSYWRNHSK